jgi:DNA polymerase-4
VSSKLVKNQLQGTTIKLKLRWPDFTTLSRQVTLKQPTDRAEIINSCALQLFNMTWQAGKPVRLLGVGVSGLSPRQYGLWEEPAGTEISDREVKLKSAIEQLRDRFGTGMIHYGNETTPDTYK